MAREVPSSQETRGSAESVLAQPTSRELCMYVISPFFLHFRTTQRGVCAKGKALIAYKAHVSGTLRTFNAQMTYFVYRQRDQLVVRSPDQKLAPNCCMLPCRTLRTLLYKGENEGDKPPFDNIINRCQHDGERRVRVGKLCALHT